MSSASTSHLDGLNWEVLVVDNPYIYYTHCYPCGKIVVTTSSVEDYTRDAHLAIVLAHEVAHIMARHCTELDTRSIWVYFIHDMLNLFVSIDFVQRMLPHVHRLPFNRRLEMEADYIGLLLMAAAGYDPKVELMVYEDLEDLEASCNEFTLAGFLRSHPPGRKRAKALARPKIMEEALVLYNDVRAKRRDES